MKTISLENNFVGGCAAPNISSLTIGYGKKTTRPTSKKPKAKPVKRSTSKKGKRGGKVSEQEIQTDTFASIPPALLAAQYGYPAAKALARSFSGGPQIFRVGENDPAIQELRQQTFQQGNKALEEQENIYNVGRPSRYTDDFADVDTRGVQAEDGEAAADGEGAAADSAAVGEDLATAAEDALVAFGKKAKRGRKTSKKSKSKSRSKKGGAKKKTVKRSTSKTVKRSASKKSKSKSKKSKSKSRSKKGGAKKKTVKRSASKTVKRSASKTVKRSASKTVKRSASKRGKKGAGIGTFFKTIWNGLKDGTQWETHGNSTPGTVITYDPNSPGDPRMAQWNKFQELLKMLPPAQQAEANREYTGFRPPVASPPAPTPSTTSGQFFSFGGAKREKPQSLQVAEREHKGAKKRYDDELKGYLADYRYNIIGNNPVDTKNKEHIKRVNAMVAEEKAQIAETTKRFMLEAEANVYTEMFNRIRSGRPTFDKFNYV